MKTLGTMALGMFGVFAAAAAQSSCTPITARDVEQCKVDADCTKRGSDFRQTRCDVAQGVCVATAGDLYTQGECTQHSDCASKGNTFVCSERGNRCINLKSPDCDRLIGIDETKPVPNGTVFLGLMSETTRNEFLYFRESWNFEAASLALKEFRGTRPEVLPGGRNVAIVSCGQTQYRRAAAHLAEAGVKAVVGPSQARERLTGVAETLFPAKVPIFTGWASSNSLFQIPGNEDLFRVTSFYRPEVLPPLTAMLARVQQKIFGGRSIKVAGIFRETGDGPNYKTLVEQELRYNQGQTPLESPSSFKAFVSGQKPREEVLATAQALVDFAPDVILPFVEIEWGGNYLGEVENALTAKGGATKPVYLHPFLELEDRGYQDERYRDKPEFTNRFFGIRPLRDIALEVFNQRFGEAFATPSGAPRPPPNAARAYETSMLALHLLYAAMQESGGANVAPVDLVKKIPRVTDSKGTPVRCQGDKVNEIAIPTLAKGGNIRLGGLFTQFDFSGGAEMHAKAVWEIWCAKPDLNAYRSGKRFTPDNGGSFVANPDRTDDGCPDL